MFVVLKGCNAAGHSPRLEFSIAWCARTGIKLSESPLHSVRSISHLTASSTP